MISSMTFNLSDLSTNIHLGIIYTERPEHALMVNFGDGSMRIINYIQIDKNTYSFEIFHDYIKNKEYTIQILLPFGIKRLLIEADFIDFQHENIETITHLDFVNKFITKPVDISSFTKLEYLGYSACNNLTEQISIKDNKTCMVLKITACNSLTFPPTIVGAENLFHLEVDENLKIKDAPDFSGCYSIAEVICDTGGLSSEGVDSYISQLCDKTMFPNLMQVDIHNNTPLAPPTFKIKQRFLSQRPDVILLTD